MADAPIAAAGAAVSAAQNATPPPATNPSTTNNTTTSTADAVSAPASDVDAVAAGVAGHRLSLDGRSATFSNHASVGISAATLWRNKAVSCESVRSFEASRKAQIDVFQDKDRSYWQAFEMEILRGRDENTRLQRFFALRIQADLAYAESLRKIRQVLERPVTGSGSGSFSSTSTAGAPASSSATAAATSSQRDQQLSVASSCMKALNTLGEVQQQLSEKFVQFSNVVRRDVVTRPLDEMVATYEERTSAMLGDGNRLDALLHDAQRNVVESFSKYDAMYREMEADRHSSAIEQQHTQKDLWLAEMAYCINVHKLKLCRVEYVKGMSALFQQYKNLEVVRVSVIQTAVDTYARKQKLMYEELSGTMAEPLAAVQKIEPERDLMNSIRRIPKNYTAAALSAESSDQKLFAALRSPMASPLLVRCGFLKHQVSGSLFKSWKDVLCAITQDQFLHLIELKESTNRSVVQSAEAMLEAIATHEQNTEVLSTSIYLGNCRLNMIGKSAVPTFEVIESSASTGLFSSVFRMESSRKFTFQCPSQNELIDWIVAAKRFVPPGASSITASAQ